MIGKSKNYKSSNTKWMHKNLLHLKVNLFVVYHLWGDFKITGKIKQLTRIINFVLMLNNYAPLTQPRLTGSLIFSFFMEVIVVIGLSKLM